MDWSPVGSNPAPGVPRSIVSTGAAECRRIADVANTAHDDLSRIFFALDGSIWVGGAASEFAKDLPIVIDDLQLLTRSYRGVATALEDYAARLTTEQDVAELALGKARSAQAEVASERAGLSDAQHRQTTASTQRDQSKTVADAKQRAASAFTVQRLRLEQRVKLSSEPTEHANLQQQLVTATTQQVAAQTASTIAAATLTERDRALLQASGDVRSHTDALSAAEARNRSAVGLADDVRSRVGSAAQVAASLIRQAKGTTAGSGWDKFRQRVRQSKTFKTIQTGLDLTADYLVKATVIAGALSLIPGLNLVCGPVLGMLLIASATVGALRLGTKLVDGRSSGWNIAADAVFVGLDALAVGGTIKTIRGGLKLAGASRAAKVAAVHKAVLGPAALGQAKRTLKSLGRDTFRASGGNRIRMTVFQRMVGGVPRTGSLKGLSSRTIVVSIASGKVGPMDVANAYVGRRVITASRETYNAVRGIIRVFGPATQPPQPKTEKQDQARAARGAWKLSRELRTMVKEH